MLPCSCYDIFYIGTGSQIVSLPYFFLNDTLISSFYILPFFSTNGIDRALPGPVLYSYVTYDVTQPLPSAPTICTPLPPICLPPVCTDNPSCREYCARVRIDCSLTGDACADEVRYTLNGENPIISSHPFQIMVRIRRLIQGRRLGRPINVSI